MLGKKSDQCGETTEEEQSPKEKEASTDCGGDTTNGRQLYPFGESQNITGRDWKRFQKVDNDQDSETVKRFVDKENKEAIGVCHDQANWSLWRTMRLECTTRKCLTKAEEELGLLFVLRDARTIRLLGASAAKSIRN